MTKAITYSDAGVNIDAANRATEKIKELARATFNARTLSEIGSFGGMFDGAFPRMRAPVLVASADGVGTKLKIAFATNTHQTVGRDLVNHCTNDILVQGARPLFFQIANCAPDTYLGKLNATVGEALLRPHVSYLRALEGLLDGGMIKGLAHITGGGLTENIPRILPEGTGVEIQLGSWPVLPVFEVMQEIGNVAEAEMFRAFNMDVGKVIIDAQPDAAKIKTQAKSAG